MAKLMRRYILVMSTDQIKEIQKTEEIVLRDPESDASVAFRNGSVITATYLDWMKMSIDEAIEKLCVKYNRNLELPYPPKEDSPYASRVYTRDTGKVDWPTTVKVVRDHPATSQFIKVDEDSESFYKEHVTITEMKGVKMSVLVCDLEDMSKRLLPEFKKCLQDNLRVLYHMTETTTASFKDMMMFTFMSNVKYLEDLVAAQKAADDAQIAAMD